MKPLQRILGAVALCMLGAEIAPGGDVAPAVPALPSIPSDAELKASTKVVKEIFKGDLGAAKSVEQKSALAKEILASATQEGTVPADRYVLLTMARDMAVDSADVKTGIAAVVQIADRYDRGSYDMHVKLTRHTDNGDIAVFLPAGNARGHLALSAYGGQVSALAQAGVRLDQTQAAAAIRPGTLHNQHEYTLDLRVVPEGELVSIAASLDGKRIVDWSGPQNALHSHGWLHVVPGNTTFSLATNQSAVRFTSVKIKMVSGQLESPPPRP